MKRLVPGKTNQKLPIILHFTVTDLTYLVVGAGLIILTLVLMMLANVRPVAILLITIVIELMAYIVLFAKVSEYRLYYYMRHIFMYLFRKKKQEETTLGMALGITFRDNAVVTSTGTFSKIIQIQGMNIDLIDEAALDTKINQLTMIISSLSKGKIIKLDSPLRFSSNADEAAKLIEKYTVEYEKITDKSSLEAKQIESRLYALDIDLKIFEALDKEKSILTKTYYLVLYNENMTNLNNEVDQTVRMLSNIGLYAFELSKNETLNFYKEFFDSVVTSEKTLSMKTIEEHPKYITFGNKNYCVQTISDLPYTFDNAWLAPFSNLEGIKLVVNFKSNPDLNKTVKRINKRIVNLGELLLQKQSESERMDLNVQIEAYQELLEQLKFNKETLFTTEIMIIYEYDKKKQKEIASFIKAVDRCKIDPLTFRQIEAFVNTFPHLPSKDVKWMQRDFPASSLAGSFPFVSDLFIDPHGDYIGDNSGPVFFDMWNNLNEKGGTRTNANIMTIGASGKGKSYLQKILLKNQLVRNSRIFVLDPENEYSYIASVFGGDNIDVSGGDIRINPFEVFPELDDEGKVTRSFTVLTKHLAFLSDFFKVVIPELTPFTRQVLQNIFMDLYNSKGIYAYGYKKDPLKEDYEPFENIKSKDYPIFDDLIKFVNNMDLKKKGSQEQEAIFELRAFLKDFDKHGRFGAIWNGKTTINLKNDLTVFNFRGLDSTSGDEIKNGQMLLITKYLMKEIINNYQLNYSAKEDKRIILVVDEAHNFIDPNFPVALDMMKNMAKRIRKYHGSLWVATQNIADFVGFDVNTRTKASAIINNCQYTFLFGLKPDDVEQVKEMYSKSSAGALTEEEINFLSMAGQGDVLLLVDTSTRVTLHVRLKDQEKESKLIMQKF